MTDVNFPQDFYLDDVGVWRLKKEKLAELNKPKPMTNEEWLKSLDTEQFAEWLADNSRFIYECGEKQVAPKIMYEEDWEMWLKQPHQMTTK